MQPVPFGPRARLALPALIALYFTASIAHFAHNAEYIAFYPNMPQWLTREHVYGVWAAITAVGLAGLVLLRLGWGASGALVLAAYGAFGLDGLGHYTLALCLEHTWAMNATIWCEAVAGVALAAACIALAATQRGRRTEDGKDCAGALTWWPDPGGARMQITVERLVRASPAAVWAAWNTPADIRQWNAASADWHTPRSTVDLREGGGFSSRMEARDGSMGFDFEGTYTRIVEQQLIAYAMSDGRTVQVEFIPQPGGVLVRETFDAENVHDAGMQRTGWQAILDNFARHVEAKGS